MSELRTAYEVDGQGVAVLRLQRPDARNAMDTQMLVEILEHLAVAREDDAVRVLVVSSSDHMGLSAGADIKEALDGEAKVRRMQLFADVYDGIVGFPKPTIAVCHGDVVGGGAEVAIACDMRVGGSNLRMRFPGAALGVPVGPARLVTLCGLAAAKYLLLSSRTVGADEALRLGLVNRVAPAAGTEEAALKLAAEVAANSPEGARPPEADAARVGRRRGPLAGRGPGPGRVAAQRSRPARRGVALDGSDQSLTVAVTGPTGEIGKPFLAALERVPEVERVIGMARRPFDIAAHGWEKVEYRRGDVLDRDSVEALVEEADVVVHLAFVIVAGQEDSREINLRGSRNVFEATAANPRSQAPRLHLLGRRLRLPRRHARAAHRGPAGARQLPPSLLGPQGRGRGGAGRGAGRLGHRRLRLPALHRRRPRRDPAARPDPPDRARPEGPRAAALGARQGALAAAGAARPGRPLPAGPPGRRRRGALPPG